LECDAYENAPKTSFRKEKKLQKLQAYGAEGLLVVASKFIIEAKVRHR
jgi:hypothetical protein